MKITKKIIASKQRVFAAGEDDEEANELPDFELGDTFDDEPSLSGGGDSADVSLDPDAEPADEDDEEEQPDLTNDIPEDVVAIATDNNIKDHYIAECDSCSGIFISSVVRTENPVSSINGECPICGKQTDQYLKWVIEEIERDDETTDNSEAAPTI